MSGFGTIDNPWDLLTALNSYLVNAGNKITLRGGTYTGTFTSSISGRSGSPIIIAAYPGEYPIIDGTVVVNGSYTQWENIEVKNSSWETRTTTDPNGDAASDLPQGNGFNVYAANTAFRGCILHDCRMGILSTVEDNTFEGCLFFNNGIIKPDYIPGYWHNLYPSHDNTIVKNNLIAQGLSIYGLHGWNQGVGLDNYDIEDNVLLDQYLFAGNEVGNVSGLVVKNNELFRGQLAFGWSSFDSIDAIITGNYSAYSKLTNSAYLKSFQTLTFKNNFIATDENVMRYEPPESLVAHDVDLNTYISTQNTPWIFDGMQRSFAQWQSTYGYDPNGTFSATLPTANRVRIIPTGLDRFVGILVIYNWSNADSVSVNMSSLLEVGTTYKLKQAQDPLVDIQTVAYDGSSVTIDMRAVSHSIAVPIGHTEALVASSFPQFGAFVVEKA